MANVTGRLTINGVEYLEVDGDPSTGGGTAAPAGSLATVSDGSGAWLKGSGGDTDWSELSVAATYWSLSGSDIQNTNGSGGIIFNSSGSQSAEIDADGYMFVGTGAITTGWPNKLTIVTDGTAMPNINLSNADPNGESSIWFSDSLSGPGTKYGMFFKFDGTNDNFFIGRSTNQTTEIDIMRFSKGGNTIYAGQPPDSAQASLVGVGHNSYYFEVGYRISTGSNTFPVGINAYTPNGDNSNYASTLVLNAQTDSSIMNADFGPRFSFSITDNVHGPTEIASIDGVLDSVVNEYDNGVLKFNVARQGNLKEAIRVTSDGYVSLNPWGATVGLVGPKNLLEIRSQTTGSPTVTLSDEDLCYLHLISGTNVNTPITIRFTADIGFLGGFISYYDGVGGASGSGNFHLGVNNNPSSSSGDVIALSVDRTNGWVGINNPTNIDSQFHVRDSSGPAVVHELDGQSSDSNFSVTRIKTTKTTNMGDGFGPMVAFSIEDNGASNNDIALIGAERNGADNTGKIFNDLYVGGSRYELMNIAATQTQIRSNLLMTPSLSDSAANVYLTLQSDGYTGIILDADTVNGGGEPVPYIQMKSDGGLVSYYLGGISGNGDSAVGGISGSTANSLYLGSTSAYDVHIGTNSVVRMNIDENGRVLFPNAGGQIPVAWAVLSISSGSVVVSEDIYIGTVSTSTIDMTVNFSVTRANTDYCVLIGSDNQTGAGQYFTSSEGTGSFLVHYTNFSGTFQNWSAYTGKVYIAVFDME